MEQYKLIKVVRCLYIYILHDYIVVVTEVYEMGNVFLGNRV